MAQIPLPLGTYKLADGRASSRRLVNCFSEIAPATSQADSRESTVLNPPSVLRRVPGITPYATANVGVVRGMWQMGQIIYVVIGSGLYQLNYGGPGANAGSLTLLASGIAYSNQFVRMTDNGFCLVIVIPQQRLGYTYTAGAGLQPISASLYTTYGAFDCAYVDTFIAFIGFNGEAVFTDDGQAASGTGPITFNTGSLIALRELGTDLYNGFVIDHREMLGFGLKTSDGYLNVGNSVGSPLGQAPNSYMPIGIHLNGTYSVAIQDQSVFWLANDATIRRRSGQTPVKVSDPGIDEILSEAAAAGSLVGCYALAFTMSGHLIYSLTIPMLQRTLAYDCTTQEWFELESLINGYWGMWRPSCVLQANGLWYVGDSQSGTVGFLNPLDFTDLGTALKAAFITQNVYSNHDRLAHRRLELITTSGGSTTQGLSPTVTLRVSDDGGYTYRPMQPRNLGVPGAYSTRAAWYNLGASRDRTYSFEISDPTPAWSVDIQADIQGGKY